MASEIIAVSERPLVGCFALRVRDDSMTAPKGSKHTYPKGCRIIVDPSRQAVHGSRILVKVPSERDALFGQFEIDDSGDKWLTKLNPDFYSECTELVDGSYQIIGVVVMTQFDEVAA